MMVMYILWMLIKRPGLKSSSEISQSRRLWYSDLVDINTVDLIKDEYQDAEVDRVEDEARQDRVSTGNIAARALWRLYYWVV